MNIVDVKSILIDLENINDNWDGYGGSKPLEEIIERTNNFVTTKLTTIELDKLTDIYPNPNGTISLEFEKKTSRKISLEIGINSVCWYFRMEENNVEFNDDMDINDDKLINDIKLL